MSSSTATTNGEYTVAYMPFIKKTTKQLYDAFYGRYDYDDMLSEAVMASLIAEKNYDPEKGKFGNFIRKAITGAITRSVTTTSSKHQGVLAKVFTAIDTHIAEHNEVPDLQNVLDSVGISKALYDRALRSHEAAYSVPFDEVHTPVVEPPYIEELNDAIERLPHKYRTIVNQMLSDQDYHKSGFKTAVKKMKQILGETDVE